MIFEQLELTNTILKLYKAGPLYKVYLKYANTDLHPSRVSDRVMSNLYEHIIRCFGASVNKGEKTS